MKLTYLLYYLELSDTVSLLNELKFFHESLIVHSFCTRLTGHCISQGNWQHKSVLSTGVLTSPQPDQEGKEARKHVRDARDSNNIETRAVIKVFSPQGNAPKEIHAILTETLACFLPGRAKDLTASLYKVLIPTFKSQVPQQYQE